MAADEGIVKTDLLIVGAGPAGASLACFLAEHGMPAQGTGTHKRTKSHLRGG